VNSHAKSWLLLAYGQDRVYAGNQGYDDGVEHYSYDSNVPNSRQLAEGDVVIVAGRDGRTGPPMPVRAGIVAQISESSGTKTVGRCPQCAHPRFKARTTKEPKFRCDFGHEFDSPRLEVVPVTTYKADLTAIAEIPPKAASSASIKELQVSPRDGNAIRPLDHGRASRWFAGIGLWRFSEALAEH
jgi:hypothetical protein